MNRSRLLVIAAAIAIVLAGHAQASAQDQPVVGDPGAGTPGTDGPVAEQTPPQVGEPSPSALETLCADRADDDRDGLVDCADADCFSARECHAGGSEERTEAACGDWIDNDGDTMVDCDDSECRVDSIAACRGSWTGGGGGAGGASASLSAPDEELPELGEGQSVEDLIGRGSDANGERTDEACSDGIDNDFDQRSDCADFGCRFDPQVTVCQGQPGLRFSVVAGVGANITWNSDQPVGGTETVTTEPGAGFTVLQLRALGPIPFIEHSFFLINVRAEDTVRLSFLLFQVPITPQGHYIQLNSGFGGLSTALIISLARQPLLDPPFALYSRFEQGNGAAVEVGGPFDSRNVFRFRAFAAGGSGEFSGSVGGGFFRSDDRNFSWAAGAQLHVNILGQYDRFDNAMPYVPDPGTIAVLAGAKFDQRAAEQFVGANALFVARWWHFSLRAESYSAFILDDPGTVPVQTGFNVTLCALIWPRLFVFAADATGYYQPQDYSIGPPTDPSYRHQRETFMWRAALHWYAFRSTGVLTLLYRETYNEADPGARRFETERQLRIEGRFRF